MRSLDDIKERAKSEVRSLQKGDVSGPKGVSQSVRAIRLAANKIKCELVDLGTSHEELQKHESAYGL